MNGFYYTIPINFKEIIEKKEAVKTNLEQSIAQYINLTLTTSFGECKFDELYGCRIWEMEFDILAKSNILKYQIQNDVKETLEIHEKRLILKDVNVDINEVRSSSYNNSLRMKKKVYVIVEGFVKKTNRPFKFKLDFFVGPLSYL